MNRDIASAYSIFDTFLEWILDGQASRGWLLPTVKPRSNPWSSDWNLTKEQATDLELIRKATSCRKLLNTDRRSFNAAKRAARKSQSIASLQQRVAGDTASAADDDDPSADGPASPTSMDVVTP